MHTNLWFDVEGYPLDKNLVYCDNQSTMKLKLNSKASSRKQTCHFNIKYFFITDLLNRGEIQTQYCPTDYMVDD